MRFTIISLALLAAATTAQSAPKHLTVRQRKAPTPVSRTNAIPPANAPTAVVYLKCTTMQNGQKINWDLTLNEPAGTIDVYDDVIQRLDRKPAQFTSDAVYFIGFTLSRVDLTLQRELSAGNFERGTCQVNQPPTRAF